jgi:Rha family phage regulatory protein
MFPATGTDLVSVDHGQAVTTSRRVAEYFGKKHRNVVRTIEKQLADAVLSAFNVLNFERVAYVDGKGETRHEYRMTHDGFAVIALAFTGVEAGRLRVRFIEAFNRAARELQRLRSQRLDPNWKASRATVAQQHSAVNAILVEMRHRAGKATEAHHLANEARLIGYAVSGVHAGLDRDTLDVAQLRTLHKVECQDMILLAQGVDYETRKATLRALVVDDEASRAAELPAPAPEPLPGLLIEGDA